MNHVIKDECVFPNNLTSCYTYLIDNKPKHDYLKKGKRLVGNHNALTNVD